MTLSKGLATEVKAIRQIVKCSFCLSIVALVLIGAVAGWSQGFGVFVGAVFACANLLLIKKLVEIVYSRKTTCNTAFLLALGIKFPILYFIGYLLLSDARLGIGGLMAGMSLPFIVIFTVALWNMVLKKPLLFVLFCFMQMPLYAGEGHLPELPNIISILYKSFPTAPWAAFLEHWETLLFSLAVSLAIAIAFCLGARQSKFIPGKWQNFLEWLVENLRNFIIEILGPSGEKYVPFLGTLFIFILCMNILVLIPLMKPPSSNFNNTAALALCVFVLVQYLNIRNYGVFGFLYHLAGEPKDVVGWAIAPLMFPIELLTQLTRPLTLALRLFGNVLGEDILIGAFALFGVELIANYVQGWPIGLPLQIPFLFLAILTSLMQALVFTLLSAIYILLAMPTSHGEHER